jgi:hypothetical protein
VLGECATAIKWNTTAGSGGLNARFYVVGEGDTNDSASTSVSVAEAAFAAEGTVGKPRIIPQRCMDVDAKHSLGGHSIETYGCNSAFDGGKNQKFQFDPATGELSSAEYDTMTSCVSVCAASTLKTLLEHA